MEGLEIVELMLIAISILVLGYTIYMYCDQKNNIRFFSPKSKAIPFVSLLLVIIGFANYMINGQKAVDLGTAILLVNFAFIMILSRNGIGETGLYFEGIRISWKQISQVNVQQDEDHVVLTYTRGKVTKSLVLSDTTFDEVNLYIKKKRKLYHFGK